MIIEENYPNAYKEVYVILQNIGEEELNKIPKDFLNLLKNNMNNEYEFDLDSNKEFEEQELLQETKAILAYLYFNYWGTEEEKKEIKEKWTDEYLKEEQEKRDKYNPDELFKNRKLKEETVHEDLELVEYHESFIKKILNKIKMWFKRK